MDKGKYQLTNNLEDFNNPDSDIFKATLQRQIEFIDQKIEKWSKTPTRYTKSNPFIQGSIEDIHRIMCLGIDRNIVQDFFIGKGIKQTRCMNCEEEGILERCHSVIDRPKIMQDAIEVLHNDDMTPIGVKDILIQYLKEHKKYPLYFLCKGCHWEYNKPT